MLSWTRRQQAVTAVAGALLIALALYVGFGRSVRPPRPTTDDFFTDAPRAGSPPATIKVHVLGQVARPGLYELPPGSRVNDALQAAQVYASFADLSQLNLAAVVQDGDRIYVPPLQPSGPQPAPGPSGAAGPAGPTGGAPDQRISINRASEEQLQRLPGVGPVTAREIVNYRQRHGAFQRLEQLKEVPGIGDAKFERMRHMLTL